MGRKSASKGQGPVRTYGATPPPKKGVSPLVWGLLAVAVIAVALAVLRPWAGSDAASSASAAAEGTSPIAAQRPAASDAIVARTEALAALGPRQQENLPPIPFNGYTPPRPIEVVTAAYEFAAEHPEILSYVPCFCGCENAGHTGSHDCFVKGRDAEGNVTEWDEHGISCTVCIDVANRSRQLFASGANVRDIRAAIDKEFAPVYPGQMPTPNPPAHNHAATN